MQITKQNIKAVLPAFDLKLNTMLRGILREMESSSIGWSAPTHAGNIVLTVEFSGQPMISRSIETVSDTVINLLHRVGPCQSISHTTSYNQVA